MICRRCDTTTENDRCPKCFEQDERARAMFGELVIQIYGKHQRLFKRLADYDTMPPMDAKEAIATVTRVSGIGLIRVSDIGMRQK